MNPSDAALAPMSGGAVSGVAVSALTAVVGSGGVVVSPPVAAVVSLSVDVAWHAASVAMPAVIMNARRLMGVGFMWPVIRWWCRGSNR